MLDDGCMRHLNGPRQEAHGPHVEGDVLQVARRFDDEQALTEDAVVEDVILHPVDDERDPVEILGLECLEREVSRQLEYENTDGDLHALAADKTNLEVVAGVGFAPTISRL